MEGLVDMRSTFWKNKKVLITGYEGFLGSNLTRTLLDYGAKIYGLDILTHRKYTILSQKELNRVNVIRGNVENLPLLSKIIKEKKIEFVFHLAARAIVGDCLRKPVRAFSTNIKGTWNILEVARNCGSQIKSVIVASSDKAYGSHAKLPYTEDTPASGSHPYDVSKSCADLIARTYYHTYKLPVAVTRCGNIYGPGDFNFSRIVPDVTRSAINNRTLIIRSDGKFTRDYIYVDDVVSGYLGIAEKMQSLNLSGEAFNFSNEKPISVLELVKTIYEIAGKKPDYKILNQAKYEIRHQYLRSSKAKKIIGWKPQYDLQQGLKKTIEWYKAYCNHEDIESYNRPES
jgi:CDP-glucose 4,6-dehydratase